MDGQGKKKQNIKSPLWPTTSHFLFVYKPLHLNASAVYLFIFIEKESFLWREDGKLAAGR